MSLLNKVAIVTGASSGIGAAIALEFAKQGARVAIVGRNEDKLKNVCEKCEAVGAEALIIVADLTKKEDCKRVITVTIQIFGKLDILINNAGIGDPANILDENAMDVFEKVMSINLFTAVRMTHLAAEPLAATKGNIVNISSIAAKGILTRNSFSYCTAKAGLDHFTRCAALELAPKGIRVNAVNPGPVKTEIIENTGLGPRASANYWDMMKRNTLFNRLGDVEEIGDLVAFIVSDKGRSMTGSTVVTDNGSLLLGPWDNNMYLKL